MSKTKSGGEDRTGRSHKSRRACNSKGRASEPMASFSEKVRKSKKGTKKGGDDLASRPDERDGDLLPRSHKSTIVRDVYTYARYKEQFGDLESMGYPEPPITMPDDDMLLVNTFEETFGDTYPEGDWLEFSKKASSNIDRYVVALASFSGEKRHFACSGFFIEWNGSTVIVTSASLVRSSSDENKIDENLRIEVLLPRKQRIKGTLQHYSLHYNVALVSVEGCRVLCPAIIQRLRYVCSKIAAVGRCFESGALMAVIAEEVTWTGTLDCVCVERISRRITKAGTGGPLVNLDGEVVGMDFYDTRIGTPIVMWDHVQCILEHFREKSKAGEVGNDSGEAFWKLDGDPSDRLNRWPVPAPCWRSRDDVDADKKSEEDELNLEPPPPSDSFDWSFNFFNFFEQEPGSKPSSSRRSNEPRSNPYIYGYIDGERVLLSV
ncbi:hypothetical protein CFC21_087577 [Triticum aestivum]|uniref:Uncharacterized protein n=3 Tax=Triticum TaxID=4564 RepID=A0A9R1II13_WHEAT|nr:uncharacterized protein LOC123133923 isoform X2 [Triticum aestivum]XP_044409242.1 uncharacterized protein LOC123133923 isoform X2 [Triticum aestivum]KAF7083828.1 hypothetical protein CFC21_087573 [Triticum aestivum]KAF7083833.1 hypothetical protein CFC21_087577 [Triticum aestivum]VAI55901.1 unnamed protein product [Triticum turgidum subsp. durum]